MHPVYQPSAVFLQESQPSDTIHSHLQKHQIYIHQNHGAVRKRTVHFYLYYLDSRGAATEPN